MAQSLSQLYIHLIFHTKSSITIYPEDMERVVSYMGGIIRQRDSIPIQIGGMPDHIHILCSLSKNMALSKFVQEIKSVSSKWIKSVGPSYYMFEWQKGYAAFSVSASVCEKTQHYIINQANHHKRYSFQDELLAFMKEYNVEYDERYLFED